MDLIRIFIDTAFSKIVDRYFNAETKPLTLSSIINEDNLIIDETLFVDECRCYHPELSDDQIRMIFGLYRDDWSLPIEDDLSASQYDRCSIFNVLFKFSDEVLRLKNREPLVVFRHLFRWRELTLAIGEDIIVAVFLAYYNKEYQDIQNNFGGNTRSRVFYDGIDFCSWPTILHNDNPHLNYIFMNNRLCELHSHLYASTDNFTISWVAIMNYIDGRKKEFDHLAKSHDESRYVQVATLMYSYAILACCLRLNLWRLINNRMDEEDVPVKLSKIQMNPDRFASHIQNEIEKERLDDDVYDYIVCDILSPMSVVAGERKFLYGVSKYILHNDSIIVEKCFYQYLLAKNKLRTFFVQVNTNRGFANFKRHQDVKTSFMSKKYKTVVGKLAVWEATTLNYTDFFETRITPFNKYKELNIFRKGCLSIDESINKDSESDWSVLIHFLKHPENLNCPDGYGPGEYVRDGKIRKKLKDQSAILRKIQSIIDQNSISDPYLSKIRGIDAASSEIGCRPEIFAQTFRFLKNAGYAATFHVGEDFYDITDGLRAIDEAIAFLDLEAGDRLGHALALGIDSYEFYSERHNYIALPMQWMLDNVVWLYYSSRKYNVVLEPEIEDFLISTFRELIRRIGYEQRVDLNTDHADNKIEMIDYYQSMMLRGDSPDIVEMDGAKSQNPQNLSWDHFKINQSQNLKEIRKWNRQARVLLADYWTDRGIIANGRKIKSFKVPNSFHKLISRMQDEMIRMVSKIQLGIECCPSSNYKIGYCKRFDKHPIFRFMPIRTEITHYPLSVTVNTDDLGVFSTSLPNEYSLLALAAMKIQGPDGKHLYSSQEVYDWVERIIKNGEKYYFKRPATFSLGQESDDLNLL